MGFDPFLFITVQILTVLRKNEMKFASSIGARDGREEDGGEF